MKNGFYYIKETNNIYLIEFSKTKSFYNLETKKFRKDVRLYKVEGLDFIHKEVEVINSKGILYLGDRLK